MTFFRPEEIKGRYDYYAFGLMHQGTGLGYLGNDQKEVYSYNGEELEESMNANLLLYGFRQMDGSLGRFLVPDPVGEELPAWSGYNYALNNPANLVDPFGLYPQDAKKPACPDCPVANVNLPTIEIVASRSGGHKDQSAERYGFNGDWDQ